MGETSFAPQALRHIDDMASGPYGHDAATAMRLDVLRRRAEARVEAAAAELARTAGDRGASPTTAASRARQPRRRPRSSMPFMAANTP